MFPHRAGINTAENEVVQGFCTISINLPENHSPSRKQYLPKIFGNKILLL